MQTKESRSNLTPEEVKQRLIEGNMRFLEGKHLDHQLLKEMQITSNKGQYPHTVVLGCIDSRATSEQIFDLGIGDIFNTRIAGNVIDIDVLGSLEFSCKLAGAKLILILGHTSCGAVTAACEGVEVGHVTPLLKKIQPAVDKITPLVDNICDPASINLVSKANVINSIEEIRKHSPILKEMEENKEIKIIGGMYNINTGVVEFYS